MVSNMMEEKMLGECVLCSLGNSTRQISRCQSLNGSLDANRRSQLGGPVTDDRYDVRQVSMLRRVIWRTGIVEGLFLCSLMNTCLRQGALIRCYTSHIRLLEEALLPSKFHEIVGILNQLFKSTIRNSLADKLPDSMHYCEARVSQPNTGTGAELVEV